jgi:hypothetical protein
MGTPSDAELRTGLEDALASVGLGLAGEVERRPSPYRTSFPIEELRVDLAGRGPATLACKRLDWEELEPAAQLAKPRFLHDPGREPAVYAELLEPAGLGAPRFYGAVVDPGRHWLFVEWVEGRELYQVGELALWEAAARWLARLHAEFAGAAAGDFAPAHLLEHDALYYRRWVERAREFARDPERPPSDAAAVEWLAERHEAVIEVLLALPKTAIHGEFYASNVLVDATTPQPRVAPVDWELAAAGPGLTDLAALVSGGWSEEDREAIVAAYGEIAGAVSTRELDFARLQLAIQWLGWAPPAWEPPAGQRQDWLGEAVALAEGLGL